jgi:hypothetical protein
MKFSELSKPKIHKLPTNYNKLSQTERRQVREQYIKKQDGYCYFCKHKLNESPKTNFSLDTRLFPKGFLENPVHLHHDHNTGLTIGVVHTHCNGVLWQYYGE